MANANEHREHNTPPNKKAEKAKLAILASGERNAPPNEKAEKAKLAILASGERNAPPNEKAEKAKLAILASGTGSNAITIIKACQTGKINAKVSLVFSNNPKAKVIEKAQALGIKCCVLDHKLFEDRLSFDLQMIEEIKKAKADFVIMAGYMRLVTNNFIVAFRNKVLNIHPAILPAFKGVHGAKDAVDYAVKLSGCTVHFVDEIMDNGAIIIQAATVIKDSDTDIDLQKRIHKLEHRIYPQAIQWLVDNRLSLNGRKVSLQEKDTKKIYSGRNFLVYPPLEDF